MPYLISWNEGNDLLSGEVFAPLGIDTGDDKAGEEDKEGGGSGEGSGGASGGSSGSGGGSGSGSGGSGGGPPSPDGQVTGNVPISTHGGSTGGFKPPTVDPIEERRKLIEKLIDDILKNQIDNVRYGKRPDLSELERQLNDIGIKYFETLNRIALMDLISSIIKSLLSTLFGEINTLLGLLSGELDTLLSLDDDIAQSLLKDLIDEFLHLMFYKEMIDAIEDYMDQETDTGKKIEAQKLLDLYQDQFNKWQKLLNLTISQLKAEAEKERLKKGTQRIR